MSVYPDPFGSDRFYRSVHREYREIDIRKNREGCNISGFFYVFTHCFISNSSSFMNASCLPMSVDMISQ